MKKAMKRSSRHVVVSGIQPSGRLHVGNYIGAIRTWLDLQREKMSRYFFIADYHSITGDYEPAEKRRQIIELAADLLALGIDPKKSTLFVQSDVPEHAELCWILGTVTPMSFLERMTQFKDKSGRQKENINMGLFDYPVLQAADILIYGGNRIPVGRDQVQHVELTRDIARFFNNKFGATFPEPAPLLSDIPKLMALSDPAKKMSKSLGEKSYIALADEPDVIREKIKRAVTETTGILSMSEKEVEGRLARGEDDEVVRGMAGVWNLVTLLGVFGRPHEADRIIATKPMKYGELKSLVAERISGHFADFRKKRALLLKNPDKVRRILALGAKKARPVAKEKMREVRKKIGLR